MNNERIVRSIDVVAMTVTFACGGRDLMIRAADLSKEVRDRAMLHGLNQTIGDAAAIETAEIDGKMHRPTCVEKLAAMRARIETLESGKWSESPERGAKIPDLIQAVMDVLGIDAVTARETYDAMSKEERQTLRKEPQISVRMAELQAARQPAAHEKGKESILARFKK